VLKALQNKPTVHTVEHTLGKLEVVWLVDSSQIVFLPWRLHSHTQFGHL